MELSRLFENGEGPLPVMRWGKVVSIQDSATPRTITINLGDDATLINLVRYLNSYSPQVNDLVCLMVQGSDIFCLGAAR